MLRVRLPLSRTLIHLSCAATVLLSGAAALPASATAPTAAPTPPPAAAPASAPGFGTPALVKDLDPSTPATGSSLYIIAAGPNGLLIRADDKTDGTELWFSDGTSGGTHLVRDLCPGPQSGGPDELVVLSGTVVMNGNDCSRGAELWTSSGSAAGTLFVADIFTGTDNSSYSPQPRGSNARLLTLYDNKVFFAATDLAHGSELWETDGTLTHTHLLTDINPGPASAGILYLAEISGTLFFNATDGGPAGYELWTTDGSAAGTQLFADINAGGDSNPNFLTPAGGQLFFTAITSGASDRELYVTDGTPGGTHLVKDILAGGGGSSPNRLTRLGSKVVFNANDSTHGREIWVSDGTLTNTTMISDVNPSGSGNPVNLIRVGSGGGARVYFSANFNATDQALYRTDGSTVERVADPNPSGPDNFGYFATITTTLYFAADDGVHGTELWMHTPATTTMVADIQPGPTGSAPSGLAIGPGGKVYFAADDGIHGQELWVSDGTPGGTSLVKNIAPDTANGDAYDLTALNDAVYFGARTAATGYELWRSQGTLATTAVISDIAPGPTNGFGEVLGGGGHLLFFSGYTDATGYEPWVYDDSSGTVSLLKDIGAADEGSSPENLIAYNGAWYFGARDAAGVEPWRTDGTPAGTAPLDDFNPGPDDLGFNEPTLFDGLLFFVGYDDDHEDELWRTDGTPGGTLRATNIYSGVTGTSIEELAAAGSSLIFSVHNGATYSPELWRWNGSSAARLSDLLAGTVPTNTYQLTSKGGWVYFTGYDPAHGTELWRTDGVTVTLLADIYPGPISSSIDWLTAAGNRVFFRANDGVHGLELWTSDGTPAGTHMVGDLLPGAVGSNPGDLAAIGSRVLFGAGELTSGYELYLSDGASITPLGDLAPGAANGNPQQMTQAGGYLFLTAFGAATGQELWALPLTTDLTASLAGAPPEVFAGQVVTYTATIHNVGAVPALGVTLTDTLPSGFSVAWSSPSQGACAGGGPLVCELGTLDEGDVLTVTVGLMSSGEGVYTNTVQAASYLLEPTPANNTAQAATTVNIPPPSDIPLYMPLLYR